LHSRYFAVDNLYRDKYAFVTEPGNTFLLSTRGCQLIFVHVYKGQSLGHGSL